MKQAIRDAIVRAAQEEGVDPTLALAIAERESAFNPRARNSKTIRGLFQMTGGLRSQYGIGDSDDPYTQAKGWARFIKDTKGQMASRAGRDVSDPELYSGHHFGAGRAGRMLRMDPSTPVNDVFTRYEMSLNPHFARAGTVGNLLSSVTSDIGRRQAKYGGSYEAKPLDLSDLGEAYEPMPSFAAANPGQTRTSPLDLSDLGDPYEPPPSFSAAKPTTMSKPAASSAMDLSDLGVPAS